MNINWIIYIFIFMFLFIAVLIAYEHIIEYQEDTWCKRQGYDTVSKEGGSCNKEKCYRNVVGVKRCVVTSTTPIPEIQYTE